MTRRWSSDALVRIGALAVILGELVALMTQLEVSAGAFVLFIVAGGGLTVIGAGLAVWGMLRRPSPEA